MPTNHRLHHLQLIAFTCSFLALVALSAFWSIAQETSGNKFAVAHSVPGALAHATIQPEETDNPTTRPISGVFSRQTWNQYHRLALPVTVGVFFLCFSCWSLTGVENLAMRRL